MKVFTYNIISIKAIRLADILEIMSVLTYITAVILYLTSVLCTILIQFKNEEFLIEKFLFQIIIIPFTNLLHILDDYLIDPHPHLHKIIFY